MSEDRDETKYLQLNIMTKVGPELQHRGEQLETTTRTAKFIRFAVASFILPVTVTHEKIIFKFLSVKCFIHVVIYLIGFTTLDYYVEETGRDISYITTN